MCVLLNQGLQFLKLLLVIGRLDALQQLISEHDPNVVDHVRIGERRGVPDADGQVVAVEIKRRGEIAGVEQLTRYLEFLNKDSVLAPVRGILAAQTIAPQAKTLALDRGIGCVEIDYDALSGVDGMAPRLFEV